METQASSSWIQRIFASHFFQQFYEYKKYYIAGTIAFFVLLIGISLYIARHQLSLATKMCTAQQLQESLRSEKSSEVQKKEDLQNLRELVLTEVPIANRFSGIVAQEELVQDVRPITTLCFEKAQKELAANNLFIQSQLDHITLCIAEDKKKEALTEIDNLLTSIKKSENVSPIENTYLYLLLQKVSVLKQLNESIEIPLQQLEEAISEASDRMAQSDQTVLIHIKNLIDFLKES